MTTQELRKKFISFFANKNHSPVASSSLIPAQDPTLLFTNAGMNQFKDLFLGTEKRSYSRATTIQKCVRAGGKHNDLDQVGFTDRHLTFFEMMGNFSFGDFFKKEAISFAWEFLTQKMKLDPKRLSITVHLTDDESEKIWHKEIGVPLNKITRLDEDNFWKMGDTGPCGPCTEIFYDRGPEYEDKIIFGQKAERHVEIWNLVFMQSEQLENGEVKALAQPGVDTGMGLERLAMILADGEHVFDSPVFLQLIEKIEQISGISYKHADDKIKAAFNVVCDHVRSSSLIIADGGKPSNDGRGYVLRKIIRRGLLFAQKLTHDTSLFEKVAKTFIQTDGSDFPELIQNSQVIENILSSESQKFRDNLTKGQNIFNNFVSEIKAQNNTQVSGEQAFKLYDTFGFPLEITRILAEEEGLSVDTEKFLAEMKKQKARSGKLDKNKSIGFNIPEKLASEFIGYETTSAESTISWIGQENNKTWISTKISPFFAACGGQVTDSGKITLESGEIFTVTEVKRVPTGANAEATLMELKANSKDDYEKLTIGKKLSLVVDPEIRANTAKNHTGTHLLQAALQSVLGKHVQQSGSLVSPDYLRFYFTHDKSLTEEEVTKTEQLLNRWIYQNHSVNIFYTTLEKAKKLGAMVIFGEKYNPETVRVIDIPKVSIELCGGTHLKHTGEVGAFKILSEDAGGVGIRKIIAVTGPKAVETYQQRFITVQKLGELFCAKPEQIFEKVIKQEKENKELKKEIFRLQKEKTTLEIPMFLQKKEMVGDLSFFFLELSGYDQENVKTISQSLLSCAERSLVLAINRTDSAEKVTFLFQPSDSLTKEEKLMQVEDLFKKAGLRGGKGKNGSIQGGGKISLEQATTLKNNIKQVLTS